MRFDDSSGPNAGGTHTSPLMGSVDDGPDSLKIGVPSPLGDVMSMAHVVAKQGTFSANITACCHHTPPINPSSKPQIIANGVRCVKSL